MAKKTITIDVDEPVIKPFTDPTFSMIDAEAMAAKSVPTIDDKFVGNLGQDNKQYGKVQDFKVVEYERLDKRGDPIMGESGTGTYLRIDH